MKRRPLLEVDFEAKRAATFLLELGCTPEEFAAFAADWRFNEAQEVVRKALGLAANEDGGKGADSVDA